MKTFKLDAIESQDTTATTATTSTSTTNTPTASTTKTTVMQGNNSDVYNDNNDTESAIEVVVVRRKVNGELDLNEELKSTISQIDMADHSICLITLNKTTIQPTHHIFERLHHVFKTTSLSFHSSEPLNPEKTDLKGLEGWGWCVEVGLKRVGVEVVGWGGGGCVVVSVDDLEGSCLSNPSLNNPLKYVSGR